MTVDIDGQEYELTPDQFQRWSESLLRDVQSLRHCAMHKTAVQRCALLAQDSLEEARRLRVAARLHAAELCLVDALLKVNEALAAS